MATLHFAGVETDAVAAVGAAIFATWAAALVQAGLIWRALPDHLRAGDREIDIQGWAKMSLPMLLISACEMVLQYADVLIVGYYLPPEQVGIYFAAAKTMALILFVQYAVGSAAAKSYAGHHARGDAQALARAVRDSVHWTFWPSLGCALFILALGKPILSLFGAEFVSGYGVMMILVIGFLMRAAMGPAEFLLNMAGEQVAGARIYMATAALNITLNFALIPLFGLYGAAAATAIATSTAAILCAMVAHRKLGLRIAIWSNLAPLPADPPEIPDERNT
jgi:O-antigen/teichoic acid export membrane protein